MSISQRGLYDDGNTLRRIRNEELNILTQKATFAKYEGLPYAIIVLNSLESMPNKSGSLQEMDKKIIEMYSSNPKQELDKIHDINRLKEVLGALEYTVSCSPTGIYSIKEDKKD